MELGLFREGLGRVARTSLPVRSRADAAFPVGGKGGNGFLAAHVRAGMCTCACTRARALACRTF